MDKKLANKICKAYDVCRDFTHMGCQGCPFENGIRGKDAVHYGVPEGSKCDKGFMIESEHNLAMQVLKDGKMDYPEAVRVLYEYADCGNKSVCSGCYIDRKDVGCSKLAEQACEVVKAKMNW